MIDSATSARPRLRSLWRLVDDSRQQADRVFSSFELWPSWFFYLPLAAQWLKLAVRHRSLTLPTLANPGMQAGGLIGESKLDILSQLGREGTEWVAPYTSFVVGLASGAPATDLTQALAVLETAGMEFPFVAKPDIGCRGAGVRVILTIEDLARYLADFPRRERIIFQKLIDLESEAGVFYVRPPGETKGRIISLTLKVFPRVVGDGKSTLKQLIMADPRARRLRQVYLNRHAAHRDRVLAVDEEMSLVFSGNHCRGAVFKDGNAHITPAMEARFDAIARGMPEFYFGRFDVRYSSLEDLKRGENFVLIEANGAGSEATHIWDRQARLRDAYKALFEQLRMAFEIGAANRARGFSTTGLFTVLGLCLKQARLMRRYADPS